MRNNYQDYVDTISTTLDGKFIHKGDPEVLLRLFGDYLKELRVAQSLSTKDLATKTGLSVGFINQLENGKNMKPKIDSITKIARVLNLPTEDYYPIYFYTIFKNGTSSSIKLDWKTEIVKALNLFGINSQNSQEIIKYVETIKIKQEIEEGKWIRKED